MAGPPSKSSTGSGVCIVGAGRMGRGIAQSYALAGQSAVLVDLKGRSEEHFRQLEGLVKSEIGGDLDFLISAGLLPADKRPGILQSVRTCNSSEAVSAVQSAQIIYEAVPETIETKQLALAWISQNTANSTVIASTTSTLGVDELAEMVSHPERFLNAHWLNPAHLMPLVEIGVSKKTNMETRARLKESLETIGKVPVICNASPGYIVPRIQALAMNEAARLVEDNVASAEDIDKAMRVGFGLRFAVLGMLEFIDWGGVDILYHASTHLSRTVDSKRYAIPGIVAKNMEEGRKGLREGAGFYDYKDLDVDAYRKQRLDQFVKLLEYLDLLPAGLGR